MRLIVAVVLAFAFIAPAGAQSSPPPDQQAQPPAAGNGANPAPDAVDVDEDMPPAPAANAPGAARRQPNPKALACRDRARQQGMRGPQLRDSVQICIEEARLSCTKKAVAQHIPAQQRRDFIRNCAG